MATHDASVPSVNTVVVAPNGRGKCASRLSKFVKCLVLLCIVSSTLIFPPLGRLAVSAIRWGALLLGLFIAPTLLRGARKLVKPTSAFYVHTGHVCSCHAYTVCHAASVECAGRDRTLLFDGGARVPAPGAATSL